MLKTRTLLLLVTVAFSPSLYAKELPKTLQFKVADIEAHLKVLKEHDAETERISKLEKKSPTDSAELKKIGERIQKSADAIVEVIEKGVKEEIGDAERSQSNETTFTTYHSKDEKEAILVTQATLTWGMKDGKPDGSATVEYKKMPFNKKAVQDLYEGYQKFLVEVAKLGEVYGPKLVKAKKDGDEEQFKTLFKEFNESVAKAGLVMQSGLTQLKDQAPTIFKEFGLKDADYRMAISPQDEGFAIFAVTPTKKDGIVRVTEVQCFLILDEKKKAVIGLAGMVHSGLQKEESDK